LRVGISTASFFNRIATENCFATLKQMHVDTAEVLLNTFSEYEKPFVDALVQRKDDIYVHSVQALAAQFEPQLFNTNPRVRADAEAIFRKVCYAGAMLGAKFYTFHGPTRLKRRNYTFDFAKFGETVNKLCEIAESYGLRLSYENVHWTYFNYPDFFKQLKKECPSLCGTLSLSQALKSGFDVYKFLDVMEDRVSTVHLCDTVKDDTLLPGKGKFNFEKLFRELDKRNVNVHIFIEVYSKDYKDTNELKDSYDYIRKLLADVIQS